MKQPMLSNRIDELNEGKYNQFLRSIAPNPEHRKIQLKKLKRQLYITNGGASLVIIGLFYAIVWVVTS